MQKRGLSGLVISVFLILVALILVMVLFSVFFPPIKDQAENAGIESSNLKILAEMDRDSLCVSPDKIGVEVVRTQGEGNISGLRFIFYNDTDQEIHDELVSFKLNERTRLTVPYIIGGLKRIEIYTLISGKKGQSAGSVHDTYNIKGFEIPCEAVTPFKVDILSPWDGYRRLPGKVDFNLSLNKAGEFCKLSVDNAPFKDMTPRNQRLLFDDFNDTLLRGSHNVSFSCKNESEMWTSRPIEFRIAGIALADCGVINISNEIYFITRNLASTGTCLLINASNVTIFGQGNTITYGTAGGQDSHGIDVVNASGISIQDLTITEGNAAGANKHGIFLTRVGLVNITDVNITTIGLNSSSILAFSSQRLLIENNFLTGSSSGNVGIFFMGTNDSIIRGNTIHLKIGVPPQLPGKGIELLSSFRDLLENNLIMSDVYESFGVSIEYSEDITLKNNSVNTARTNSVVLFGDQSSQFFTNLIDPSNSVEGRPANYTTGPGCRDLIIDGVDFRGKGEIIFAGCVNITIKNSLFERDSLNFFFTINSTIERNRFDQISGYGIFLHSFSDSNLIRNNTIDCSGPLGIEYAHGIYIHGSSFNKVLNNSISTQFPRSNGIYSTYSHGNNFTGNSIVTMGEPSSDGIRLSYVQNYFVYNNTVIVGVALDNNMQDMHGIRIEYSDSTVMDRNNITTRIGQSNGIYLFNSPNNFADDNVISILSSQSTLSYGIYSYQSSSETFNRNTIFSAGPRNFGIYSYASPSMTMKGNSIKTPATNSIVIRGNSAQFGNSIDPTNLAEGLPVSYNEGALCNNRVITGQDYTGYGQMIFANCNNLVIKNSNFGSDGLNLFLVSNSQFRDDKIASTTGYGIFVASGSANNIIHNAAISVRGEYLNGILIGGTSGDGSVTQFINNSFINASSAGNTDAGIVVTDSYTDTINNSLINATIGVDVGTGTRFISILNSTLFATLYGARFGAISSSMFIYNNSIQQLGNNPAYASVDFAFGSDAVLLDAEKKLHSIYFGSGGVHTVVAGNLSSITMDVSPGYLILRPGVVLQNNPVFLPSTLARVLNRSYIVNITVKDSSNAVLSGLTMQIKDASGSLWFSNQLNHASGLYDDYLAEPYYMGESFWNVSGRFLTNPYLINVSRPGNPLCSAPATQTINADTTILITLPC